MDYPVFELAADIYSKLPQTYKVFNIHQFSYYLWISIPKYLNRDFRLVGVYQMSDDYDSDCPETDITDHVVRIPGRPWLRVLSDHLNKSIGMHVYKIEMINEFSNDLIQLYFNYIVQDDSPPKPYDYMTELREYLND